MGRVDTLRLREHGQALVLAALCMFTLMAMACLAVDLSGAWLLHSKCVQDLELAKDACMQSLNEIKYAENPARTTAGVAADTLFVNGDGTQDSEDVTVWYWEADEGTTGEADRIAGVYVTKSAEYKTVFGGFVGASTITVSADLAWYMNPYSTETVYRPPSAGTTQDCTRARYTYHFRRGDGEMSQPTWLGELDTLPADLRDAVERGLSSIGKK